MFNDVWIVFSGGFRHSGGLNPLVDFVSLYIVQGFLEGGRMWPSFVFEPRGIS